LGISDFIACHCTAYRNIENNNEIMFYFLQKVRKSLAKFQSVKAQMSYYLGAICPTHYKEKIQVKIN
jgi:hypothetical protein